MEIVNAVMNNAILPWTCQSSPTSFDSTFHRPVYFLFFYNVIYDVFLDMLVPKVKFLLWTSQNGTGFLALGLTIFNLPCTEFFSLPVIKKNCTISLFISHLIGHSIKPLESATRELIMFTVIQESFLIFFMIKLLSKI